MQQVVAMHDSSIEDMDNEQPMLELTFCIVFVAAQWLANPQAAMRLPTHIGLDSRVDQQVCPD